MVLYCYSAILHNFIIELSYIDKYSISDKVRLNIYDKEGQRLLKHYIGLVQKGSSESNIIEYNYNDI